MWEKIGVFALFIMTIAVLSFTSYFFMKGGEEASKSGDHETGCGMTCVAMMIMLIIAQMIIVVLTAGQ